MAAMNETAGRAPASLATTYHGRDDGLLERVLPTVDLLEVTPDSLAEANEGVHLNPRALASLEDVARDATLIVHGVGLSIASFDGWWGEYLRLLDELMERVPVAWHSEHLGYTRVKGEFLGTMLPVPKTAPMLEILVARVEAIQERYQVPFLLENVVHLLPDYPGEYTEAGFLNALTEATGCGLVLDVYNLRCDEANHGFDIAKFLEELRMDTVVEVHIAGGVEYKGFKLDVHSRPPEEKTVNLARDVLNRAEGVRAVTYELLEEAVPVLGPDRITQELGHLRAELLTPAGKE
jgi:uncharacterized protein (UPF0276 family)